MRWIDLFAGAGGATEGATQVRGVRVVWAGNHWKLAVDIHKLNHPDTLNECQDLEQADWREVPRHDALWASPSCIGHSQVATAVGKGMRGKAPIHDALRSSAWAVVSCLEVHRSRIAIVENVAEFQKWILYPAWIDAMKALGYALHVNTFDAAEFGVPQNRKRIYITAVRAKKPFILESPRFDPVPFAGCVDHSIDTWEPVATKPPGVRARVAKGRRSFPRGMFVTQHVTDHPGRSLDRPLATVTTKHQIGLVREGRRGDEHRMLSVDEYRCAMAFPEGYLLPLDRVCDSVKLLGNAVCPPVARELVQQVEAGI